MSHLAAKLKVKVRDDWAPDAEWLRSLRPGGRLVFPWQPTSDWGHTTLVTRHPAGLSVGFLMPRSATSVLATLAK